MLPLIQVNMPFYSLIGWSTNCFSFYLRRAPFLSTKIFIEFGKKLSQKYHLFRFFFVVAKKLLASEDDQFYAAGSKGLENLS